MKNDMLTRRFSDFDMDALSKSLRLPHEKHFESQKVVRAPSALVILPSKSLSRLNVVQISRNSSEAASF